MNKIKMFLLGLLYENNEPSLTRCIIAASFVSFIGVSLYLCIMQLHWDNYGTFASIAGGGSIGGKIADKVVAVVKGSPDGMMPGPKNGGGNG
jgi:hypothetical protein